MIIHIHTYVHTEQNRLFYVPLIKAFETLHCLLTPPQPDQPNVKFHAGQRPYSGLDSEYLTWRRYFVLFLFQQKELWLLDKLWTTYALSWAPADQDFSYLFRSTFRGRSSQLPDGVSSTRKSLAFRFLSVESTLY